MELQIIAHAHNGFSQKFGIPRQSREDSVIETHIVFTPTYRMREALRGIEEYSHLWLLWGFSQCEKGTGEKLEVKGKDNWSPTVRPPRLGGNKRMGVFATRSPFRPNPIGLTSVRLLRVEDTTEGLVLVVSGADLLDGTPIYDIKPYLSFSDSHPDAKNGFAEESKEYHLDVRIDETLKQDVIAQGCPWDHKASLADVAGCEENYEEESVDSSDTERDLGHYVIVREEMLAQTVNTEEHDEDTVHSVVKILCTDDGVYSGEADHKLADQH